MSGYMHNRELSWLKFNERVMEEAACAETPLLERLRFLSIFTSNLDEFFMVRVGSLVDLMAYMPDITDGKTGMTPRDQLQAIYPEVGRLMLRRDALFAELTELLRQAGVEQLRMSQLKKNQLKAVEAYFTREVLPVLSPQIIDARHPFPHIANKQLTIACNLRRGDQSHFGMIPVPTAVGRMFFPEEDKCRFVLIEDMLLHFADRVFSMFRVGERAVFCVTRNADIDTDAGLYDEDMDYREHMSRVIQKRLRLAPVRLEIQGSLKEEDLQMLLSRLKLKRREVYMCKAPLEMSYSYPLEERLPLGSRGELLYAPFAPQPSPSLDLGESILRQVRRKDVLLSYPYERMDGFLELIRQAAKDPAVVSIKITLYRIARQSKLAESLIEAAERGKEVTVLMELRARFDERNNIEWAQRLQEAGCRVIYGMDGFKVHSKICLITRKDHGRVSYVTQVGTGNYNEKTAKVYTDLSLITANEAIGRDAAAFFNNMALGDLYGYYQHLWIAPVSFKERLLMYIDREMQKARSGEGGRIIAKCNSLTDKDLIEKLREASCAGVKIQLIVRGICCLIPGVPGQTENIQVISIVGRFLEHSRIYCFGQGEQTQLMIASGDMMTRNTERRVEIACPVWDEALKARILEMLDTYLMDNVKARDLMPDGQYVLRAPQPGEPARQAQQIFMQQAVRRAYARPAGGRVPWWRRIFARKG